MLNINASRNLRYIDHNYDNFSSHQEYTKSFKKYISYRVMDKFNNEMNRQTYTQMIKI